jgi:GAF domain-containing protein
METLQRLIRGQQSGAISDAEYHRQIIQEIIARIGSTRASIWYFNHYRDTLTCEFLYDSRTDEYSSGAELHKEDFPAYFSAILASDTIDAAEAHRNPLTIAFSESYLDPLEIKSLLDVPIQMKGIIVGIICCEYCEETKYWTKEDIEQLQMVSATMSLAIPKRDPEKL